MIELGQHWEFIIGGYAAAALVVGALIAWVAIDSRRQTARVAELEAQRERRRAR